METKPFRSHFSDDDDPFADKPAGAPQPPEGQSQPISPAGFPSAEEFAQEFAGDKPPQAPPPEPAQSAAPGPKPEPDAAEAPTLGALPEPESKPEPEPEPQAKVPAAEAQPPAPPAPPAQPAAEGKPSEPSAAPASPPELPETPTPPTMPPPPRAAEPASAPEAAKPEAAKAAPEAAKPEAPEPAPAKASHHPVQAPRTTAPSKSQQPSEAHKPMRIEPKDMERQAELFRERFKRLRAEIQKAIVGQSEVIDGTLVSMVVGGHVLLEGVPGLGKTFLLRTLAEALALDFDRVQFTPDLMPADILGTNLVMETEHGGKFFQFQEGPIFTNILLADEINRATPKTQSALLEAMQEKRVTVGGETRPLGRPFFVLATQNPLEQEGTYPLPEAQLDRFFFKIDVPFPSLSELEVIMDRTTGGHTPEVSKVVDKDEFLEMQAVVREVPIAKHVQNYALRLVLATHPGQPHATPMVNQFVNYGSSPRGAQTLVLAGKAKALLDGRLNVAFEDIAWAAMPALRHRAMLNFEGEAEGMTSDMVLQEVLKQVPKDAALAANL